MLFFFSPKNDGSYETIIGSVMNMMLFSRFLLFNTLAVILPSRYDMQSHHPGLKALFLSLPP